MAESAESQQLVLSEVAVIFQQVAECNAALHAFINKRAPYLMAVHAASPEQKALMQLALADFDQQTAPFVNEYKRKMRVALQGMIDHAPELMKFFE